MIDADRVGADDEDLLPGRDVAAPHRMGADREEFDHRSFIKADAGCIDEVVVGNAEKIRHAAVAVDAENIELLAAIGLAAPAGDAIAAGEIGNDCDALADLKSPA